MARKKTDADASEGGDEGGKKKKGKLVPAVVVAVGLLGAGWFLGPGKSAGAAPGDAAATTTTTIPGEVVVLEPITLNVPGNHYLKVGMALQMKGYGEGEEAPAAAEEEVDPKVAHAPVLDAAIDVLGGTAYEQLVTPQGRNDAKVALVERMKERYDDELEDIYFTEFVLQ